MMTASAALFHHQKAPSMPQLKLANASFTKACNFPADTFAIRQKWQHPLYSSTGIPERWKISNLTAVFDKKTSTMTDRSFQVRSTFKSGIQSVLEELCCKQCGSGPATFKEDISNRHGLCTNPYIHC